MNKLKEVITNSNISHKSDLARLQFFNVLDMSKDDNKRHFAMLDHGIKLIEQLGIDSVLTIGDKFTRDAAYIKKRMKVKSIASDLDTLNMIQSKENGYVDDLININVENINLEDESFDVVFCKESYHHFPRPQLGLYEMLRVAKKAVVLIEPNDIRKNGCDNFVEDGDYLDSFEDVGNYKYQVSLREILKTAWALNLPHVGVLGFNDPYQTPFVYVDWLLQKNKLDRMGMCGQRAFNILAIGIYKSNIKHKIDGVRMYDLPPRIHK